jgi:hypothetical protein
MCSKCWWSSQNYSPTTSISVIKVLTTNNCPQTLRALEHGWIRFWYIVTLMDEALGHPSMDELGRIGTSIHWFKLCHFGTSTNGWNRLLLGIHSRMKYFVSGHPLMDEIGCSWASIHGWNVTLGHPLLDGIGRFGIFTNGWNRSLLDIHSRMKYVALGHPLLDGIGCFGTSTNGWNRSLLGTCSWIKYVAGHPLLDGIGRFGTSIHGWLRQYKLGCPFMDELYQYKF